MTGINKFEDKERRRQRRELAKVRNPIARDLHTPKYGQRIVPDRRRTDNSNGNYYFTDEYYEDE